MQKAYGWRQSRSDGGSLVREPSRTTLLLARSSRDGQFRKSGEAEQVGLCVGVGVGEDRLGGEERRGEVKGKSLVVSASILDKGGSKSHQVRFLC